MRPRTTTRFSLTDERGVSRFPNGFDIIDGDVRFDDDGQLVNYRGRGIIFAAGDVEYDEVVCSGGNGAKDCWAGDMSDWHPDENLMIILSGGYSEYD